MGHTRGRRREKKKEKESQFVEEDFIPLEPLENEEVNSTSHPTRDNRSSFFGLLDRQELEYFKNAENILATNSLSSEERPHFVENVFTEAKGKELKLATNQVCSKLFERLVNLADEEQLLQLMQAVEPFVVDLAYQKFSSHCLEALISKAIHDIKTENSLRSIANKLGTVGLDLIEDQYASHVLTTLLLKLSGVTELMRSKRSQLARKHTEIEETKANEGSELPPGFRDIGRHVASGLLKSLDPVSSRKLAINPISSPAVQALIIAEARLMSTYKLVDSMIEPPNSSGFISHCLSDRTGSHFLETVIKVLPSKKVSNFVASLPLAKISANGDEMSSYLLSTILGQSNMPRKKKVELLHTTLSESITTSVPLALAALELDFDFSSAIIMKEFEQNGLDLKDTQKSALYERLSSFNPFLETAVDTLTAMEDKAIEKMGTDPTQSYVIQSLLRPSAPTVARKRLLNKLIVHVLKFSVNAYGSHIIDGSWDACYKLKFVRERIANELLKFEASIKHSAYGRKNWKNWHMEKYIHKRYEWWQIVKAEEDKLRDQFGPEVNAKSGADVVVPPVLKKRKV